MLLYLLPVTMPRLWGLLRILLEVYADIGFSEETRIQVSLTDPPVLHEEKVPLHG